MRAVLFIALLAFLIPPMLAKGAFLDWVLAMTLFLKTLWRIVLSMMGFSIPKIASAQFE